MTGVVPLAASRNRCENMSTKCSDTKAMLRFVAEIH